MVMCGMSAAFSGLFGTPITAAIFALEVVSVGVMYYAAIVPCVVSSLVSVQLARFFGLHIGTGYLIGNVAVLGPWSMAQVCVMEMCIRDRDMVGRSRGRANKDLGRLADQLKAIMETVSYTHLYPTFEEEKFFPADLPVHRPPCGPARRRL